MTHRWRVAMLAGLAVGLACTTAGARSLAAIRDRGLLSLCAHANALPFASKTQDPPGFQIELARALADALGVALQVEWVTSGVQFRVADCDIVLDTIAVPEVQAERRLELSRPYQRSGVGLAMRPTTSDIGTFEDLTGRRVAVRYRSLAAMLLEQRGAQPPPPSGAAAVRSRLRRGAPASLEPGSRLTPRGRPVPRGYRPRHRPTRGGRDRH